MGLDMTPTGTIRPQISVDKNVTNPALMYASLSDEGYVLPEIPYKKVKPEWRRQVVVDPTGEAPGTIVVQAFRASSLLGAGGRRCDPLRRRHRQVRLRMERPGRHPVHQEVADLDAAARR